MSNATVIDLGIGNTASVCNLLTRIGQEWTRSKEPLEGSDIYFLPGVGSFDVGMEKLRSSGWAKVLSSLQPSQNLVGICLGMQLLCEGSEEGESQGLGLLPGRLLKFRFDARMSGSSLKTPHMGWNTINPLKKDQEWLNLSVAEEEARYYFVHSYYYPMDSYPDVELGSTRHGLDFVSVVGSSNVYGFQFHPEKSHHYGSSLIENLLKERSFA